MTTDVSNQSEQALRQRMIEDMRIRGFIEKTRKDYLRHLETLTDFLGRSPLCESSAD